MKRRYEVLQGDDTIPLPAKNKRSIISQNYLNDNLDNSV